MTIPTITEEPFLYVQFDQSNAESGPTLQPYTALLIGQRTSSGTVDELVPTRVTSADQAGTFFGRGSIAHGMAEAWFASNNLTETWIVALDDDGGATAATQTITVTGAATASGTVFLYIAGKRLQVGVSNGDDANTIAAAIDAAIAAESSLPVTSGVVAAVVTVTAKNKGTQGNSIDVRVNYNPDEVLPAGVGVTIAPGAAGATDPDLSTVWAVLGDVHYNVLAVGLDDSASLDTIDVELSDRWEPDRAIEGVAFVGTADTHANLITKAAAENGRFLSLWGAFASPSPPWKWAAATAAIAGRFAAQDPARPFKTLELKGILAPAQSDRFDLDERELLVREGVSTWTVDGGGRVRVSRAVTTYKTDATGTPDASFKDVQTPLTLGYLRFDYRAQIASRYGRHKLADDENSFGTGQAVVTPSILKGETIAIATGWAELGLIENLEDFKAGVTVSRDATNRNRVNVFLPPDLVNKFLVLGATVGFRL